MGFSAKHKRKILWMANTPLTSPINMSGCRVVEVILAVVKWQSDSTLNKLLACPVEKTLHALTQEHFLKRIF